MQVQFLSGVPIWVVGRADMQLPFKQTYPGSTPGRPINSWAFGRTVMLLTLNQADTGSTPVAPTKTYPCNPIGRGAKPKIWKLLVQIQSGVLVNMRGWSNGGSWGCIIRASAGSTPAPVTKISAGVAQLAEQLTCNQ